jgi:hypothetical protein
MTCQGYIYHALPAFNTILFFTNSCKASATLDNTATTTYVDIDWLDFKDTR